MLERELGRGGMATVYLARDLWHGRPVALKVLHPELAHALVTGVPEMTRALLKPASCHRAEAKGVKVERLGR